MIIVKDPDAVLDYAFDWTDWLAEGETIDSFTVTATPDTVTIDAHAETDGVVTVWLSGGAVGTSAGLTCHVVTTSGREDDRTMHIRLTER